MISQFGIAWAAGHGGYAYIFVAFSLGPLLAYFAVRTLVGRLGEITVKLPDPARAHA
jgi:hypothetical protein